MLYKLRDGHSCFDDNPELLAIPEFAKLLSTNPVSKDELRDRRMRFVILVSDRRSPLRTLPEKRRREQAAIIAGYPMEGNRVDRNGRDAINGNVELIENAIAKYKELQHDENQDTLDAINSQIQQIKDFIKSDKKIQIKDDKGKVIRTETDGKAIEMALKMSKQLPELLEAKQKVEQLLNIVTEHKPEVTTHTAVDLESVVETSGNMSTIDQFWASKRQKQE